MCQIVDICNRVSYIMYYCLLYEYLNVSSTLARNTKRKLEFISAYLVAVRRRPPPPPKGKPGPDDILYVIFYIDVGFINIMYHSLKNNVM